MHQQDHYQCISHPIELPDAFSVYQINTDCTLSRFSAHERDRWTRAGANRTPSWNNKKIFQINRHQLLKKTSKAAVTGQQILGNPFKKSINCAGLKFHTLEHLKHLQISFQQYIEKGNKGFDLGDDR